MNKPVLVRCAGCGHNFETRYGGRLSCPTCRSVIWIEPSDSLPIPPPEEEAPAPEEDASVPGDGASPEEGGSGEQAPSGPPKDKGEPDQGPAASREEMEALRSILSAGQRLMGEAPAEVVPLWETSQKGIVRRFLGTIKQVFLGPPRFFAGLKVDRFYRAFSFGWLLCTLGVLFFSLYGLWQLDANYDRNLELLKANPDLAAAGIDPESFMQTMRSLLVFFLYAAPLVGALNLWLTASLYHVGVKLILGKNRGFKATFRATAYGFVPLILLAVPLVGHLIGGVWSLVMQVVAIAHVHRVRPGRAALAVLLPSGMLVLIALALF